MESFKNNQNSKYEYNFKTNSILFITKRDSFLLISIIRVVFLHPFSSTKSFLECILLINPLNFFFFLLPYSHSRAFRITTTISITIARRNFTIKMRSQSLNLYILKQTSSLLNLPLLPLLNQHIRLIRNLLNIQISYILLLILIIPPSI